MCDNSLSNIGQSAEDTCIADPHRTRRNPSTHGFLISSFGISETLGNDVSNRLRRGSIDEMVRCLLVSSISQDFTSPLVLGAPKLKLILLGRFHSTSLDIDMGVIG